MLSDILQPLNVEYLNVQNYEHRQMFHQVKKHVIDHFPDLTNIQLAIVGIAEDRNAIKPIEPAIGLQQIRTAFYQLFNHNEQLQLADLGNLNLGANAYESYQALSLIVEELLDNEVLPIILGGSQDLTNGQFLGYLSQKKLVNLAVIDQQIDLYDSDEQINNNSYLYDMLNNQAQRLYNVSVLGYQLHLVNPLVLETLESLHFDNIRLGQFKTDPFSLEPAVRNADLLSFDLRAIRYAEAPGVQNQSPNGFNAIEACRLCWYAGISDHISSIGFYEYASNLDQQNQTAQLIAQMVAYFIEGFCQRKNDIAPIEDQSLHYKVNLTKLNTEIDFIKSKKSDRWWMKIDSKTPLAKPLERHQLVPCTYKDYLDACDEKIPQRWQQALAKLKHWNNYDLKGIVN